MDFDQTQAIDHSEEEIEHSEEDKASSKRKEVAHLKVFSQQGFEETIFPIHQGDNYIGRSAKCDVTIPIKALSKKHACVEVQKDLYLIYDCNSKNRSKKGKSFLKPSVRYEVKHGDMITLGDVKCQYLVGVEMDNEEEDEETGSETESESMLPVAASEDDIGMDKSVDMCQDDPKKSNGKVEIEINELLHSTQNYPVSKPSKDNEKAYAADTDSGTDDDMPHKVTAAVPGTVFYSSEDEEEVPRIKASSFKSKQDGSMDGQTLAFGLESPDYHYTDRHNLMDSAGCIKSTSLAPVLTLSPDSDDHLSERSDDPAHCRHGSPTCTATGVSGSQQTCEPTLPCVSDESTIKRPRHPAAVDPGGNQPTLPCDSESDDESTIKRPRHPAAVDPGGNQPTLPCDSESDDESTIKRPRHPAAVDPGGNQPTLSCGSESDDEYPIKRPQHLAAVDSECNQPTLHCGSETDDESTLKRPRHPAAVNSGGNQPAFEPTLVYGSESEEESPKEKARVSEAFNEPTILYESDSEEGINRETKGREKSILSIPTLACTFESKEESRRSKCTNSTRGSSKRIEISKCGADSSAAEQRVLENEVFEGAGRTVNTDAKLPYGEISYTNDESEPDTADRQTNLKKTLSYAEPTLAYDIDEFEKREGDNEPNVDVAETYGEDSATQQYTADSDDESTSIRQREARDKKEALQQTVAYDLEATQAYLVEGGPDEGSDTSDSQPLPPSIETEATQDANLETLAYGLEDGARNSASEAFDRDDSNENDEHVPMENKTTLAYDLQATQAYGTTAFDDDDDDDDDEDDTSYCDVVGKGKTKVGGNEANQKPLAYELEATQAYGANNNGDDNDNDSPKAVWHGASDATKPTVLCGLAATIPYSGGDTNNSDDDGDDGDNSTKNDLKTDEATYCMQQENQATLAYGVDETLAHGNEAALQEAKVEGSDEVTMSKRLLKRGRKQASVTEKSQEADGQQIPEDEEANVTDTVNKIDGQTESEVTFAGAGSRKGRRGALRVTLEHKDQDRGKVIPGSVSQRGKKRVSSVRGKVEVTEDDELELPEISSTRRGKQAPMRITLEPEKQGEELLAKQASSSRTRGCKRTTRKTVTHLEQEEGAIKQTLSTGRKSKKLRGGLLEESEDERSGTPKAEQLLDAGSSRRRGRQTSKTVILETPMKTDKPTESDVFADPQTSGSEAGLITEKINVRRGARGKGNNTTTKTDTVQTTEKDTTEPSVRTTPTRERSALLSLRRDWVVSILRLVILMEMYLSQTTGPHGAVDSPLSKESKESVATPSRGRSRGRGTKIRGLQGSEEAWQDSSLSKEAANSVVSPTPSRQRSRGRGAKWTEPQSLEASINFDETLIESPSVNVSSAGRNEKRGKGKRVQKSSTEPETSECQTSAVSDVQMAPSPILPTALGRRGQVKGRRKRQCPSSQQFEVTDESSQEASTGGPSENSLTVKGRGKQKQAKQIFEQEETSDSTVTLSETPELSESIQDSQESIVDSDKGHRKSRLTKNTTNSSQSLKVEVTPLKKSRRGKQPSIGQSPTLHHEGLLGGARPKIMFTGLVDKQGGKVVTSLGGELVDNIHNCTHLVTDKVRRTVKFLCGLAGGQIIVLPSWLEACKKAKSFVDTAPFLVKDKEAEKQYKFDLQRSHELALQRGLLEGYKVHVTKKVKPEPTQMKDIIQSAKGEFLPSVPKNREDRVFIISCEEDKAVCKKPLEACIPVVGAEVLLTGVLQQNLNLAEYGLFGGELLARSQDSTSSVQSKRKRGTAHATESSSSTPEGKGSKRKRR